MLQLPSLNEWSGQIFMVAGTLWNFGRIIERHLLSDVPLADAGVTQTEGILL